MVCSNSSQKIILIKYSLIIPQRCFPSTLNAVYLENRLRSQHLLAERKTRGRKRNEGRVEESREGRRRQLQYLWDALEARQLPINYPETTVTRKRTHSNFGNETPLGLDTQGINVKNELKITEHDKKTNIYKYIYQFFCRVQ